MGETRVDLLHLLEDLRDAYPGALEETILTEIVANSLDSGARRIQLAADAATAGLVVVDDGSGMRRRELARYHDIASSAKTRGQGIGFAGVGIKLGLLVCEEVLTETRRGKTHVATRWHLASRHRAPWKWIPPLGMVAERGTAVRLRLRNPLSPLLDAGFVEAVLRRHYQPLFAPFFAPVLVPWYPRGVTVEVNGRALEPEEVALETAPLEIRAARKRKPSALGYLMRAPEPLPEERRGLAISTLGKVIKHGWDWLGVTPAAPERIGGLIEVPALAECLTLNKADFVRVGPRGATYLAYRKLLQEAVSRQLAAWGDVRDQAEESRRRVARPVERDLERVPPGKQIQRHLRHMAQQILFPNKRVECLHMLLKITLRSRAHFAKSFYGTAVISQRLNFRNRADQRPQVPPTRADLSMVGSRRWSRSTHGQEIVHRAR